MTRKSVANPFAAYAWLGEAGWVFMMHSAQLWANPANASARLAALGAEKQNAVVAGMLGASLAAMRGASPDAVATAAMAPARRKVRSNAKALGRK